MRIGFLLFFLISCSGTDMISKSEKRSKTHLFDYKDFSGNYTLRREVKYQNKRLVTRAKLLSKNGKELESQVSVSKIGTVSSSKNKNIVSLLPQISQFRVWFNKKEYFSQLRILRKKRKIEITTKSPEEKWNSVKNYGIPKGNYFCYFSQLPECLKAQNLLLQAARKSLLLFVIWDNFPYHNEQYEGLGSEPILSANLSLSKHSKTEFKYALDIGNQVIFYHFDRDLDFTKMFWVSQGVSVVKRAKESL